MARLRTLLVATVFLLTGFTYGYVAHRDQLFPYGLRTSLMAGDEPEVEQTVDELQDEQVRQLLSLGYLAGYEEVPDQAGVTIHDAAAAFPGLNLLTSGHGTDIDLFDMDGKVVHRWSFAVPSLWDDEKPPTGYFRRAHAFDNGDLLTIYDSRFQRQPDKDLLLKLDADSNLIWSFAPGVHHDLEVQPDGSIYILTREYQNYSDFRDGARILEDYVTVLDENGKQKERVSIFKALRDSPFAALLERTPEGLDILHTNTLEVLDGRLAGKNAAFRAGNVLVSIRTISAVVVIDMESQKAVWSMTDMWRWQHQPTILENGNMLVFDNKGHHGFSKVLEFDPFTQEVAWSYQTDNPEDFHSDVCGSNARLPNGNTLITESTAGRVLEVTPDGQTVWEYFNPYRAGDDGQLIAIVPELVRLDIAAVPSWAKAP